MAVLQKAIADWNHSKEVEEKLMKAQHSLEVSSEIVGKQRHRHIGERVKTASEEVTDMIFLSKWKQSDPLCRGGTRCIRLSELQ